MKTKWKFCNNPVVIRNDHVFNANTGRCLGPLYEDEHGGKSVMGEKDKGPLEYVSEGLDY